jgi:hypothetical protein
MGAAHSRVCISRRCSSESSMDSGADFGAGWRHPASANAAASAITQTLLFITPSLEHKVSDWFLADAKLRARR